MGRSTGMRLGFGVWNWDLEFGSMSIDMNIEFEMEGKWKGS